VVEVKEEVKLPEEIEEYLKTFDVSHVDVHKLINAYLDLHSMVVEYRRQVEYWKKQYIMLEETLRHVSAEMNGLLEAKFSVKELATQYFLTFANLVFDLFEAMKLAVGKKFWIPWQDLFFIIAIVTPFAFFYGMRDWLSVPQNQLFFFLLIVTLFSVPYMLSRGRRRRLV